MLFGMSKCLLIMFSGSRKKLKPLITFLKYPIVAKTPCVRKNPLMILNLLFAKAVYCFLQCIARSSFHTIFTGEKYRTAMLTLKVDPLSQKCIRILRIFLVSIGGWSCQEFGRAMTAFVMVQRKIIPLQSIFIILAGIYYLVTNYKTESFFVMGHVCITCGLTSLMLVS